MFRVSVVLVAECDHRKKINITFGTQKDFIYLLTKKNSEPRRAEHRRRWRKERNVMRIYYTI